ncbi:MAG: hypothetical protein JW973_09320 [Bacteroidales bacterium]|nr:hypothetical protein [Bacteroidales bacterium]
MTASHAPVRLEFGAKRLGAVLSAHDYNVIFTNSLTQNTREVSIVVGEYGDVMLEELMRKTSLVIPPEPGKEGYAIVSGRNIVLIAGADASGALYGCIELADSIQKNGKIPLTINKTDQPEMVLRGTCVGLQKTTYLPDRNVYEYPYTPDNFPWFYDKDLWIRYLDMLVENRMNSLFLWNGHPFASLVKLSDYPYAVEVNDTTFKRNEDIYYFITREADKRGIWVIQMFYNIIVSKPFAEHHGIRTQDRSRPITPLLSDYTRKSIAAFIEKYPNVGLMVCLGEAINTLEDDIEWFTGTILPAVQDGLKKTGADREPPIILRGHDTDPQRVMAAALPLYRNLYTMQKYNGESLTTYEPRGAWVSIPRDLSRLGSVHIANVHILANLEPFRYGSPDFIQRCVQAMHDLQGANGLHLYPQASYWDWPYTADKTGTRILEMDRDRIWYQAWARYAWNCRRNRIVETEYWSGQLEKYYGCRKHGKDILTAYEESGQIAPKLLRRFGISDGNRQTLLLGMFMSQLVNPYKWRVYSNFYHSNGPEGEILVDWAEKEWKGETHTGETPPQIIQEVLDHGRKAKEAIDAAERFIEDNKEEFSRLKNDVYCYDAIARFFANKVNAAMHILRYRYSRDTDDLDRALPFLEKSLSCYAQLVELTRDRYLYANSMQTGQRRIPIEGTNGRNKTWEELMPHYKAELDNFKNNIGRLKTAGPKASDIVRPLLKQVAVELLDDSFEFYSPVEGQKIYSDKDHVIQQATTEIKNLKGIKLSYEKQIREGTVIRFRNDKPVKVITGYFNGHSYRILSPPALETDAHANDHGQADIRIANALNVSGLHPVNIYTYYYEPGEHTLQLGKGICLVLGFISGHQEIDTYDAGKGDESGAGIDWLFY